MMVARRAARGRGERRRAVLVVSRYHEGVTRRLLEGALETLGEAGWTKERVEVVWVPGAFELPLAVDRALASGRYCLAVALGAVVRGETPHFEYVSSAAVEGLSRVALNRGLPVGFGVLTCDTLAQALERAGGDVGNKGSEAAAAALEMLEVIEGLGDGAAR